jgi:hypothetical protein
MLVGGLEQVLFFHILGIIIPTDELIFFRGVAQPPTRYIMLYQQKWKFVRDTPLGGFTKKIKKRKKCSIGMVVTSQMGEARGDRQITLPLLR